LAVLDRAVLSCPDAMISLARSAAMQLCLDLGGSRAPATVLWELVGSEERRSAIALLATLITQTVTEGQAMSRDRLRIEAHQEGR
jgi:hypothetical protein